MLLKSWLFLVNFLSRLGNDHIHSNCIRSRVVKRKLNFLKCFEDGSIFSNALEFAFQNIRTYLCFMPLSGPIRFLGCSIAARISCICLM
ncbi:hypothetical protein WN943_016979 [Citrus x changshan-huyou]